MGWYFKSQQSLTIAGPWWWITHLYSMPWTPGDMSVCRKIRQVYSKNFSNVPPSARRHKCRQLTKALMLGQVSLGDTTHPNKRLFLPSGFLHRNFCQHSCTEFEHIWLLLVHSLGRFLENTPEVPTLQQDWQCDILRKVSCIATCSFTCYCQIIVTKDMTHTP